MKNKQLTEKEAFRQGWEQQVLGMASDFARYVNEDKVLEEYDLIIQDIVASERMSHGRLERVAIIDFYQQVRNFLVLACAKPAA